MPDTLGQEMQYLWQTYIGESKANTERRIRIFDKLGKNISYGTTKRSVRNAVFIWEKH